VTVKSSIAEDSSSCDAVVVVAIVDTLSKARRVACVVRKPGRESCFDNLWQCSTDPERSVDPTSPYKLVMMIERCVRIRRAEQVCDNYEAATLR
jgi:hypothetical protein